MLLCIYCCRKSHRFIQKLYEKVSANLNWDTVNRLFLELFFDYALYSVLNLHTVDWQDEFPSIRASNAVSAVCLALICGTLTFYIVSYFCMPRARRLTRYMEKFEPLFADTDNKRRVYEKWYLLLVPALHFTKSLLFVSLVVISPNFVWLQVALLNFTCLISAIFTLWYMPLDGRRANLFSAFDDVCLLLLTYLLWSFTDNERNLELRN